MRIPTIRVLRFSIAAALCAWIAPASLVRAGNEFRQSRSADPEGTVEIFDMAGSIELTGWNRPEIEVTGAPDDIGDRVHISGGGDKTSIHVRPGVGASHAGEEPQLVIHVPEKSEVKATLVSADLKVQGLKGDANLRTVSGNISGEVGGDLLVNTATGSIRLTARGAKSTEVRTINGDIELKGGSGEVEIQTVSGNMKVDLATLTRGRFHSISGNLIAHLSLAPDAELDGESVSGNLRFDFPAAPSADFDIQSFSGNIDNCFGPKTEKAHYGPGERLEFKNGQGQARVRIETKSGDVHLCTGALRGDAPAPVADYRDARNIFYVI
jgi:putative adhesin